MRTALGASPRHLVVQLARRSGGAVPRRRRARHARGVCRTAGHRRVDAGRDSAARGSRHQLARAGIRAGGVGRRHVAVRARAGARAGAPQRHHRSQGGRHAAPRARAALLHRGLVVAEVAFAAALLVGSVLLVRTVARNDARADGRHAPRTPSSRAFSSRARLTPTGPVVATTHGGILDQARQQPGVRAAGASNFLPFDPGWRVAFAIEGQPPAQAERTAAGAVPQRHATATSRRWARRSRRAASSRRPTTTIDTGRGRRKRDVRETRVP